MKAKLLISAAAILLSATCSHAATLFTPLGNTCVIADTRTMNDSPLSPGDPTYFAVRGVCGIPTTASAVHVNIIPVNNGGYGSARVFDGGTTGTAAYPLVWWSPYEGTRVSAPVILCQPVLECYGSDMGVMVLGTATADVVIVAEGYYTPVEE